MLEAWVIAQRRQRLHERGCALTIGLQHLILLEAVEHRQRCPTRQGVAGVRMRVQEAARHVIVEESLVDGVAREHQRQGQVAAADAFGQAQQVGPDRRFVRQGSLLEGEERAGTAASDRDLVGDQLHLVPIAQRARGTEVGRVVHRHAGGPLHQGLEDQRRDAVVASLEEHLQFMRSAQRHIDSRFAGRCLARVGRHHLVRTHQQRVVGVAEHRHIGDGQRT
ncbi:hypothetical protein GALL_477900 [mine drainage metagenome]|uniref:Uncharacterized protein n=1 Tax=mine drainage metagenome TaxID=410659 RepID=A0A1J5PG46_9ZZZZ